MSRLFQYFDLNRRVRFQTDVQAVRGIVRGGGSPEPPFGPGRQIAMYFGTVIGVIFSSAVDQFRNGQGLHWGINAGVAAVSFLIALILMPQVYDKLKLSPSAPFIVQMGLFVQQGVFWQVLLQAAQKLISSS